MIDVPAQAVVKFVLELLMRHQEGAAPSPAMVEKPSSSTSPPPSSPSMMGGTDASASEKGEDEEIAKDQDAQQADLESNEQEKVSRIQERGCTFGRVCLS